MRCMRADQPYEYTVPYAAVTLVQRDNIWQSGLEAESGWGIVPLRPIWPGFAINTVFYAVGLWGLFAAPFALRRWRRIKRGLCPKCAYPVGTSDVCTECGARVRQP